MMRYLERAVIFPCRDEQILGILSRPEQPSGVGLVLVVGGPQYRVGSHRQFVLLSRRLAEAGHAVLRFDYRGMGDSTGIRRDFQAVGEDIGAALATLRSECPEVQRVVLWGLCDAASAILLYCGEKGSEAVAGLCLLNPWVRSQQSHARAQVRHYYFQRLFQKEFWRKLLSGRWRAGESIGGLLRVLKQTGGGGGVPEKSFQERMADALFRFQGRVLLILSGRDLTAREFDDFLSSGKRWSRWQALPHARRVDMPEADHTFSSGFFRGEVEQYTLRFLEELETA